MFSFLNKFSNLQQRVIIGLPGAALIVTLLCYNEWTYFILFFAICFFATLEFHNLLKLAGINTNKVFGAISGMSLFSVIFFIETGYIKPQVLFILFLLFFLLFLIELFQTNEKPFERIAYTFLGTIYIALPFSLLHFAVIQGDTYNYKIAFGSIFLLWANDVGGYFGGKALGKHKLYERVSPKKTWEGSISGALMSIMTAIGLFYFMGGLTMVQWVVLALIIVIAGSLGDLIESQLKRSLSIKDSGQSIPGHGGFLDRFDGLLLAAPFIAAYFELLN